MSAEHRAVLLACAAGFDQRHIHVKPLGRFGYTGACLFEARFDPNGIGPPYVIKIDDADKINDEYQRMAKARAYFRDALSWMYAPNPPNGKAALLYQLFTDSSGNIRELREVYADPEVSDRALCQMLEVLYADCTAAHRPTYRSQPLGTHYSEYLREKRPDRINEAHPDRTGKLKLLGGEYLHPRSALDFLKHQDQKLPIGFSHGDLHPNNVVLNKDNTPALIDYAWAETRDITLDFALMECSLRFLLFPSNTDWDQHRWVAQAMLEEEGPESVISRCKNHGFVRSEWYHRMACAIRTVRTRARECGGDHYDFSHYLTAQFFVLYGLSKLEAYPYLLTLDALGLLGTQLVSEA